MTGFRMLPGHLNRADQGAAAECALQAITQAPLYTPAMPKTGRPLSVQMTNMGPLGWVTDKDRGYRYQSDHPGTGRPWPPIPPILIDIWRQVSNWPDPPQACLVNWYGVNARMGLHVDADEASKQAPVVSISLGDRARFRLGGVKRTDKTHALILNSGDVVVLGGDSRRFYHGIDRIYPGTSTLLPKDWRPGRINLNLRRVTV